MLRPTVTRVALVALLGTVLVACLVVPVFAADHEYSIWQWWTDQAKGLDGVTPVAPPWGSTYAAATPADIWAQYSHTQLWTIPTPATPGYAEIQYEYAGNAPTNTFGWYDPVSGTQHQIFSGPDSFTTGPKTITFVPPMVAGDQIGFYLGTASGRTYYSQDALNAPVSLSEQRWVKVFNNPLGGWVMAWEDTVRPSPNAFVPNPANDPLTWHAGLPTGSNEPDYNDMIVTFKWQSTPELSTLLLLGLSLVAVPVVCRKRRS
jgi:hypothetical protein